MPGTLTGDGQAEQIMNAYTTWNMFQILGVRPMLGRDFVAEDAFSIDPKAFGQPNPNLPPGKVMLTHGLWQRRFGSDPSVIGRTIQMDGWGSVVVGVLPPDFRIYLPADAAGSSWPSRAIIRQRFGSITWCVPCSVRHVQLSRASWPEAMQNTRGACIGTLSLS